MMWRGEVEPDADASGTGAEAEEKDSIPFARMLSLWLFDFHQPERDFWKTMNISRLSALFDAYNHKAEKPKEEKPRSLSQYLISGGA